MGQNFLANPNIATMIVEKGGFTKKDTVVEIGAGLGALTIPLASRTKHVFAVEPDRAIAALLKNELLAANASNVSIVEKNILHCELPAMVGPRSTVNVAGNLPYHISSPVLLWLIRFRQSIDTAVLMFQKEVAQRLVAKPGTKTFGRLSVLIQYCADVSLLAQVAAASFHPKPAVDSAVVQISFFETPPWTAKDEAFLFALVAAAFGQRRKMLKNALLKSKLGFLGHQLSAAFEETHIAPERRAETLSVKEFVLLSEALLGQKG
jgi:16S rRNA (adenine1518-N6/adenine1519-N6)-dimethyltransferase